VSQYAVVRLDCQIAAGLMPDRSLIQRVQALTERSSHPLMRVRLARMQTVLALADGQLDLAAQAARQQADTAQEAGLLEPLVDAWLLLACSVASQVERQQLIREALALAERQGFADLVWRARSGLTEQQGSSQANVPFEEHSHTPEFAASQAQKRAPWLGQ